MASSEALVSRNMSFMRKYRQEIAILTKKHEYVLSHTTFRRAVHRDRTYIEHDIAVQVRAEVQLLANKLKSFRRKQQAKVLMEIFELGAWMLTLPDEDYDDFLGRVYTGYLYVYKKQYLLTDSRVWDYDLNLSNFLKNLFLDRVRLGLSEEDYIARCFEPVQWDQTVSRWPKEPHLGPKDELLE